MNNKMKGVKTNMGVMPLEDYYDIKASQYGYDSYEEMRADGLSVNVSEEDLVEME
jgi:hypothetical protein